MSPNRILSLALAVCALAGSPNKWKLITKTELSTGEQDTGEYLEVNMSSLPAKTSTGTVTLNVNEAH